MKYFFIFKEFILKIIAQIEMKRDSEFVPEKDEHLTLEQYHQNLQKLGTLGHDAKLLWLDPGDGRIPFAGAFWDIFDSVAVSSPESHVGDDFLDMQAELKAQFEQLPTMSCEKKKALLGKGFPVCSVSCRTITHSPRLNRCVCHVGKRCHRLPLSFATERANHSNSERVGD
jgi:hypothetical protein